MVVPARIVATLVLLAFACNEGKGGGSGSDSGTSTGADETPTSGDSTSSTGPTTSGGETLTSGSTSDGEAGDRGLLGCGIERDCLLSEHFFMTEPGWPSECAAEAVRAGEPALFMVAPYYLPYCEDWIRLVVLAGDGTVVVQTITADAGVECEARPTVYEAGPQQRCELDLPQDFEALTEWFPVVKNCVEGEWYDCESLHALLDE